MSNANIPKWLLQREGLTQRQWKARKRREVRELERALGRVLRGCVYTPICGIGVVLATVREWRDAVSVKRWGR
jgi:hypothetical protein